jgi:AcrR family transcriptional regulator
VAQVSFRTVSAEAGVSVSLIQHYFGTKHELLVDSLNIQSADLGAAIAQRLETLGPDARPLDRVRTIARSFIPTDDDTRTAMLVYLGFAAAALTDPTLRQAEAFANGRNLTVILATELRSAQQSGDLNADVEPNTQALAIVSLVLGLSLAVLLGQTHGSAALAAVDQHLNLLHPNPSA